MSDALREAFSVWGTHPNKGDGARALNRCMWLRRMCLPSPPHSILDIGCGGGAGILSWVAGDIFNDDLDLTAPELSIHAGIDVREDFVESSRQSKPGCRFEVFDLLTIKYGNSLPFDDNSYDVVLATEVMEHLYKPDWLPVLKEFTRVGKKQVLLTVPDGGQPDRKEDHCPKAPANTLYEGHQYEPCMDSLRYIMQNQGLFRNAQCWKILGFFASVGWIR